MCADEAGQQSADAVLRSPPQQETGTTNHTTKNKHDSSHPWKSLQYFTSLIPGDVWQPGGLPVQRSGGLAGD